MIMSAIFIETFFSICGACAPADAVNASESITMARNFPVNDMFSSLSERSSWRDLRLQQILIFHRVRWAQSIYLGNLTFVQANSGRVPVFSVNGDVMDAGGERPCHRRAAEQRQEPGVRSFDHLIGSHLQRQWHLQAQPLRGLEIDHQLNPCWLLAGKLAQLGGFENLMNVKGGPSIHIRDCLDRTPLARPLLLGNRAGRS